MDSGLARNAAKLEAALRSEGLEAGSLKAIILTHGHADHAGGASAPGKALGVPVIAGVGDEDLLAAGHNDRLCPTNRDARDRLANDQAETYPRTAANHWVGSSTSLAALTGLDVTVIPVPGHTPGSLVLRAGHAVFVGDLFRGSVFGHSAEVHFYMCDLEANRTDVQNLLGDPTLNAATFFTGHFGPLRRSAVAERFLNGCQSGAPSAECR